MKTLEILDALIITQNSRRDNFVGNLLISGDHISYIGKEVHGADETINASGKMVIPGLINTHCHVAMTHLRGKLDDIPLSRFLELTFKLDADRTTEGLYNSSLLGIYEMINGGITSFADLYYSEDVIAKAVEKAGIRGFLAWNTLDEDKTTQKGNPTKNAENFISKFKGKSLVTPSVGVQGVYVASDEVYMKAREIAEQHDTIIQGHLAETREEVYNFVGAHDGERPTEHLERIGFLNPRFLAAHGVWNTLREVRLMAKNSVKLSWNPVSNAKLGVGGNAPVTEYISNGVNVSIGSDSSGSNNSQDVLQGMKFGSITVKNERWNPAITNAQSILDMATINAADALGRSDIGSIEPGKKADMAFFDLLSPKLLPTDATSAISNIVYSADPSCISDVMIGGRFVKRDWKLAGFNPSDFQGKNFI